MEDLPIYLKYTIAAPDDPFWRYEDSTPITTSPTFGSWSASASTDVTTPEPDGEDDSAYTHATGDTASSTNTTPGSHGRFQDKDTKRLRWTSMFTKTAGAKAKLVGLFREDGGCMPQPQPQPQPQPASIHTSSFSCSSSPKSVRFGHPDVDIDEYDEYDEHVEHDRNASNTSTATTTTSSGSTHSILKSKTNANYQQEQHKLDASDHVQLNEFVWDLAHKQALRRQMAKYFEKLRQGQVRAYNGGLTASTRLGK